MGENNQHNRRSPIFSIEPKPVDAETLSNIIRQAQASLIASGVASVSATTIPVISEEELRILTGPYVTHSQVLRNDWLVPNTSIRNAIEEGNREGYVFISCIFKRHPGKLVLCEIRKDSYSDGSSKIRYIPLTADTIKRMPE